MSYIKQFCSCWNGFSCKLYSVKSVFKVFYMIKHQNARETYEKYSYPSTVTLYKVQGKLTRLPCLR